MNAAKAANPKMRTHGFVMIHSAAIKRNTMAQSRQPYRLDVTGTWKAAAASTPIDPCTLLTKSVAAGTRLALEDFARKNQLPTQPEPQ